MVVRAELPEKMAFKPKKNLTEERREPWEYPREPKSKGLRCKLALSI